MSALLPTTSRAASLGYKAVRYYAAAALKPTPESQPSSSSPSSLRSSEAGPSRHRSPAQPLPSTTQEASHPLRVHIAPGSETSLAVGAKYAAEVTPVTRGKPRTPTRQAAVRKAQAFAKALQARTAGSPESKAGLLQETVEPTIDDLLAKKPKGNAELYHPKYRDRYEKVYATIDNAFTQQQLVRLVRELGSKARTKDTKRTMIPSLLARWGWEPPVVPVEPKARGEIITKDFDLETADVFLFLRDEPHLERLLANAHPPTFSVIPQLPTTTKAAHNDDAPAPSRTTLRVTGSEAHMAFVTDVFAKRKESKFAISISIKEELEGYHPPATLINALPSLYGCFVEQLGPDTLRLSSSVPKRNMATLRILVEAASRRNPLPTNHLDATILPARPPREDYAEPAPPLGDLTLSPFCTSSKGQLPWDVAACTASASMARLRRTVIWEGKPSRSEDIQRAERIDVARVWTKAANGSAEQTIAGLLRSCLETVQRDAVEDAQPSVVLTFGHLLKPVKDLLTTTISPGDTTPRTHHPAPTPPSSDSLYFVPSATPCMIQYPLNTTSKRIRRLRYRCIDSLTPVTENRELVYTWEYPTKPSSAVLEEISETKEWQDELDAMMEKAEADVRDEEGPVEESVSPEREEEEGEEPSEEDMEEEEANPDPASGPLPPWSNYNAEVHTLSTANLRLPDRPVDAHLAARSTQHLPHYQRLRTITHFFRLLEQPEAERRLKRIPPPKRIPQKINGEVQRFTLIADEECHITEADRGDGVILRTVKTIEPDVAWSRTITHTELEYRGTVVPDSFWRSFAEISRDVPPNAGALLREIPSY